MENLLKDLFVIVVERNVKLNSVIVQKINYCATQNVTTVYQLLIFKNGNTFSIYIKIRIKLVSIVRLCVKLFFTEKCVKLVFTEIVVKTKSKSNGSHFCS